MGAKASSPRNGRSQNQMSSSSTSSNAAPSTRTGTHNNTTLPARHPRPSSSVYPSNMRPPVTQPRPMAQAAAPPPHALNPAVQPTGAVREGQKVKQPASVDPRTVGYEPDNYLLKFTIVSTIPNCSYEVHTGVREVISGNTVTYVPNRSKPAPTVFCLEAAQEAGELVALLDEEVANMHPQELVYNPRYAKHYPCVIVLRWTESDGQTGSEHTYLNLGAPGETEGGGESGDKPDRDVSSTSVNKPASPTGKGNSPPKTKGGPRAPGKVQKQLLCLSGSVYDVQSMFGADDADDVVMASVAGENNGPDGESGEDGESSTPAASTVPLHVEEHECVVCLSAPKDTCVIPCRHLCLCKACAAELLKHSPKCPVCRQPIAQLLHMAD